MKSLPIAILATAFAAPSSVAFECNVSSGSSQNVLLELYTSEGCSSCPPAERWLSRFNRPGADRRAVPVAFHVDYWDSLGWRDRFADRRYTDRQRDITRASGARFVYTPQVLIGGRDTPDWYRAATTSHAMAAISSRRAKAVIEIDSTTRDDSSITGSLQSTIEPGTPLTDLVLYVVAEQNGLVSKVTAGENNGERLSHDFVAREMISFPVVKARESFPFSFKPGFGWHADRMLVAAFIQNSRTGDVIQAVSTRSCR